LGEGETMDKGARRGLLGRISLAASMDLIDYRGAALAGITGPGWYGRLGEGSEP